MERDENLLDDVGEPALLPDREAMSILPIGADPTTMPLLGGVAMPDASATDPTADATDTTADASGGGGESVTEDDRSETVAQSDSAQAES